MKTPSACSSARLLTPTVVLRLGVLLALAGLMATHVRAELRFEVGVQYLQPNQAGQTVDFFITNTGASSVEVGGLDLYLQVADGGPPSGGVILGPTISGVNLLIGPLFLASNASQAGDPGNLPQLQFWSVSINSLNPPLPELPANSSTRVVRVTFDTTGFGSGSWDLLIIDTKGGGTGDSELLDPNGSPLPAVLVNGMIIIPEPAGLAWLTLGGLLLARRRPRKSGTASND